jgi:hypothetical protein
VVPVIDLEIASDLLHTILDSRMTVVHVKISAGIATVTLDSPTSLNSFTREGIIEFLLTLFLWLN